MQYTSTYQSPAGELLLACDQAALTGLWFQGGRFCTLGLDRENEARETTVLTQAKRWLDVYFSGREPDFTPPLHLTGTPFQRCVWALLREIPYGETTTYGELARRVAARRGLPRMSAQAVGGAVGHNPVSIIVPCHRVVGSGGSLTGYAGGLEKKLALLTLEGVDRLRLSMPKGGAGVEPVSIQGDRSKSGRGHYG